MRKWEESITKRGVWVRPIHVAAVVAVCVTGCGTIRDSRGTVHDGSYLARQAHDLSANAPLLWPFVPLALPWNGLKALSENGRVMLAGTLVDEQGRPLNDVQMQISHARIVTFDLDDDIAVFEEWKEDRTIGDRFSVGYCNQHMITLRFLKQGYRPANCHLELVKHDGWTPWDYTAHAEQEFYGQSPLRRTGVVVVMKKGR